MAEILHRISIDAPAEAIHPLLATKDGVGRWWTGRPLEGDEGLGGKLLCYFDGRDGPAAVMEVIDQTPERIVWRVADGPADWLETEISFVLRPTADGGTTLLFSHTGWRDANEFMGGCSTNWGAYLTSLKSGVEGHGFGPYPAGEVSRWS